MKIPSSIIKSVSRGIKTINDSTFARDYSRRLEWTPSTEGHLILFLNKPPESDQN